MKLKLYFLICLLSAIMLSLNIYYVKAQVAEAQEIFIPEIPQDFKIFTPEDSVKWSHIQEIKLPEHYKHLKNLLPFKIDNSTQPYFRPLFNDVAFECGQASGVALGYTYEINYQRNLPANITNNQYPTHFVYNFHNDGQTYEGASFFDSWEIIQQLGTPNVTDYGGTLSYGGVKRWMTGYNSYYNAMHNRLYDFYMIRTNTAEGIQTLKQWINDHLDGSAIGGVANFYSTYMSASNMQTLPTGTEEAGKYVVTAWSSVNHGMTICGYNDSIRYDYNGDGQYTNNLDITNDGIVDVRDWEIGGVKFANTYSNPGGNTWGNSGFAYAMYRTFAMPLSQGGVWNQAVYVLKTKETYEPLLTYKITLTHNCRNKLKISAGIASDTLAISPEHVLDFTMFNYHGGNFYMQGGTTEADKTMEFGLDVSPLLNFVEPDSTAKFFLLINESDAANAGTGKVNSFSLMDYTNILVESQYPALNVPITENGLTSLGIIKNVHFSDVSITTNSLPEATAFSPYSTQLTAAGGTSPYHWDFDWRYNEQNEIQTFPSVNTEQITTSNNDDGYAVHNLDFSFPFFGKTYNKVVISCDGFIMFEVEDFEWIYPNSNDLLYKAHTMIAPYFADLKFYTASNDKIWFSGDQNSATIRWDGSLNGYSTNSALNFALTIYPSGKIEFFYGTITLPVNNFWVSGVSRGNVLTYQKTSLTNTFNIPINTKITFDPIDHPEELSVSDDGILSGTPLQEYFPTPINFMVTDNNELVSYKTLSFNTSGANGLMITNCTITSGNDNVPEFGETALLSIEVTNFSSQTQTNATLTFSISDPMISLTDNSEFIGTLTPNQSVTLSNAISFIIDEDINDNHQATFETEIQSLEDTTNSFYMLTAYAPNIQANQLVVDDNDDNALFSGETSDIKIITTNIGGADLENLMATISSNDPYIVINSASFPLSELLSQNSDTLTFNVTAIPSTPEGHLVTFNLEFNADNGFFGEMQIGLIIGKFDEDFETGDFNQFPWTMSGTTGWTTVTPGFNDNYCSKSGTITDSQTSTLQITVDVITESEISFYRKVSCEEDPNGTTYDYLAFYIDNVKQDSWDGELDWQLVSYMVPEGTHLLRWIYFKDYSASTGSDAAWIDNIQFPQIYFETPLSIVTYVENDTICAGENTQLIAYPNGGSGNYMYSWTPENSLDNSYSSSPLASPQNSTNYTVTLSDGTNTTTAEINIYVNPAPQTPVISQNGNTLISSAATSYQWYNENGMIPNGITQNFTPSVTGDYYVIVTDETGCHSLPSNSIHFVMIGIDLPENLQNTLVNPNPFSDEISFTFHLAKPEIIQISVLDIQGRIIKQFNENQYSEGEYTIHWNATSDSGEKINSGMYYLRLKGENSSGILKIIYLP